MEKIGLALESRRGHLGHIEGKGGTGRHLGGIWDAPGGLWEFSRGVGALGRFEVSWALRLINCAPLWLSLRFFTKSVNFNCIKCFFKLRTIDCVSILQAIRGGTLLLECGSSHPAPLPRPAEPLQLKDYLEKASYSSPWKLSRGSFSWKLTRGLLQEAFYGS